MACEVSLSPQTPLAGAPKKLTYGGSAVSEGGAKLFQKRLLSWNSRNPLNLRLSAFYFHSATSSKINIHENPIPDLDFTIIAFARHL